MKMLLSLFLFIALTGCAATIGNKRTSELYESFPQSGNFSEIEAQYGEPNASWKTAENQQVHQYQYVKFRHSPLAYIPFIYFFTSTSGVNYETIFVVDKDDKVVDARRFYSRIKGPHNGTCPTSRSPSECIEVVNQ